MIATIANERQLAEWNGATGRHWTEHADRYEQMGSGFADHLFAAAAVAETDRVLDIGCGTGATTLRAGRLARRGRATGIDLSRPMLRYAEQRAAAEGFGNVTFMQGDAQVDDLGTDRFDTAVSRAGVMFFDDAVAAFRNVHGALRAGGRLFFVCHRDLGANPIAEALLQSGMALDLVTEQPGVAAFSDPDRLRGTLQRAGFSDVGVAPIEATSLLSGGADAAAAFLVGGTLHPFLGGLDGAGLEGVRSAIASALRKREDPAGNVRWPAGGWLVSATAASSAF